MCGDDRVEWSCETARFSTYNGSSVPYIVRLHNFFRVIINDGLPIGSDLEPHIFTNKSRTLFTRPQPLCCLKVASRCEPSTLNWLCLNHLPHDEGIVEHINHITAFSNDCPPTTNKRSSAWRQLSCVTKTSDLAALKIHEKRVVLIYSTPAF